MRRQFARWLVVISVSQAVASHAQEWSIDYRAPVVGTRFYSKCEILTPREGFSCDSGWETVLSVQGTSVRIRSEAEEFTEKWGGIKGLWPLTPGKKLAWSEKQVYLGETIENRFSYEVLGREPITTAAGTFDAIKIKRTTYYAASGYDGIEIIWWDPVSALTIVNETIQPEQIRSSVEKITRRPEVAVPSHAPAIPESRFCYVGADGKSNCMVTTEFRALTHPKSTTESGAQDSIDIFRRDAISYKFSGTEFDKLVVKAMERAGYRISPSFVAGPYIETEWKDGQGRSTLLRKWLERSKASALITKDLYAEGTFWVLFACAIQESPGHDEWAQVSGEEQIKTSIDGVLSAFNATVQEAGGAQLGRRP